MKHAILILAHKDFDQVRHLIEYFVRDCYVYVHIDKKAAITPEELHSIDSMPQVRAAYRKYKVHWGGFSILKTEMFLLRQVLKDGDCDYVHLISGQDYPIKPLDDFLKFFEEHKGKEFIRYANIPNRNWDHYTFSRFQYYYPYDYINKSRKAAITVMQKIIFWEHKLGIKRRIPDQFDRLYGSTQWFSITRTAVQAIIDHTNGNPSFYRRARWTFAAEEYYIATVLVNVSGQNKAVPSDLRFIIWRDENGNCPANLGIEHFRLLASSNKFLFARKMESDVSKDLIRNIDKYLIKDSSFSISATGVWFYDGFQRYSFDSRVFAAIYKICRTLKIENVVDVGCGPGFYTAALRSRGIPTSGFDGNPNTSHLSSLLLPPSDEPCEVADLTKSIEVDIPFDLVLCMNTLNCIPHDKKSIAYNNLCSLSKKYILIIEDFDNYQDGQVRMSLYEDSFSEEGYYKLEVATSLANMDCSISKKIALLLAKHII